jgi:exonuclease III
MKLNDIMNEMDLANIYRLFHPKTKEYTFFSVLHGTFSKTDHVLGHKINFNRYKNIELIPCILSDHHRLEA